jgi:hypothetical protein
MKKMVLNLWLVSALLLFILHTGCSHQEEGIPEGKLTKQSDCKLFAFGLKSSFAPANEKECIHYRYSGNTLYLTHQNTAFNCCPGKIMTTITVSDQIITIKEREQAAGCQCMCLYDLEMEISNLPPGTYRIITDVPYLDGQSPLNFSCDLEENSTGEYCADRKGYPWEAAGE